MSPIPVSKLHSSGSGDHDPVWASKGLFGCVWGTDGGVRPELWPSDAKGTEWRLDGGARQGQCQQKARSIRPTQENRIPRHFAPGADPDLGEGQRPRQGRGWALFPASLVSLQRPRAGTRKPCTCGTGWPKGDTFLLPFTLGTHSPFPSVER